MGGLGHGENRQGPDPRPSMLSGATLSRLGLCAGPGGGAGRRRGRRGPLRGGGWAHLPPGWPCGDFLEPRIARGPSAAAASPCVSHSPPSIVPRRGGPGPGALLGARFHRGPASAKFCRRGTVTVLPPESALLLPKGKKKGAVNL